MTDNPCQRWRDGRDSYVVASVRINPRDYEVAALDVTRAKAFVLQHHYSGSFPQASRRFGLWRGEELVGVAVYSYPWQHVVEASGLRFASAEVLELSRFVLLDNVPAYGETWFLARTREQLRAKDDFVAVISFSDDQVRKSVDGHQVFGGHIGIIYQAFNAHYTGRGKKRTIRLFHDGSVFSDRCQTKIRRQEQGWEYSVEQLCSRGAPRPGRDIRSWLRTWRDILTRTMRHPGCHRYVWALNRRVRRHLPASQPYPKFGGQHG